MVRKERLNAGDGVHINVEVGRISCGDEDELREIFTLMERVDWKSEPVQHPRITGIQRQLGDQRWSTNNGRASAISIYFDH